MIVIQRAQHYIAGIYAESGNGGHSSTFAVAVALIKGFDLSAEEAWPLFVAWNETNARPPWREPDLGHKLREAAKANKLKGYLLNRETHRSDWGGLRPLPETTRHAIDAGPSPLDFLHARQATWPPFRRPTTRELDTIAQIRRLPNAAVYTLNNAGLLDMATLDGHECYIICEKNFAQARRIDGLPLPVGRPDERTGVRSEKKAKNLWGSQGAFIGETFLRRDPDPVLLVEGCIGLLEAVAAIGLGSSNQTWTALATTSAGSRFSRDPGLLDKLRGRRVRIVPDLDPEGMRGAESWAADLMTVGCHVDGFDLRPHGLKDLGEVVADPIQHSTILEQLLLL